MKVPVTWLRELIDTDASAEEMAKALTMSGIEVSAIEKVAPRFNGIKATRVIRCEEHPLSRDLLIILVDYGGQNIQVVTSARNIEVGDMVPLALPGAQLPRGQTIRETQIKGETSGGMLCCTSELLLGEEHAEGEGILILPGCQPGDDIREVLGWEDTVLELDLTPNYAHCLSLLGVAGELRASLGGKLSQLRLPEPLCSEIPVRIEIADPRLCPRYSASLLRDVTLAPSPAWMQFRLWAGGIRPISNVVDVTNYVMLELGQPMHAFDFDTLGEPTVIVRRARKGESLLTLDGQKRLLEESMLVIANPEGPMALAGIMGGEETSVTGNTTSVLLESATFDPRTTGKTSRLLGLRSEASTRFEKGTDVEGTTIALQRAAALLEDMGAARSIGVMDKYPSPQKPRRISLRPKRVNEVLGTAIPRAEMTRILKRLGFTVEKSEAIYHVTVPTKRVDVTTEIDLVEEIARIYGYDKIPTSMPQGPTTAGFMPGDRTFEDRTRELLVSLGLTEVITYSFTHSRVFDNLRLPEDDPSRRALGLANPLVEDQSIMRTLLLPNLLEVLGSNFRRNVGDIAVFEISRTYRPGEDFPEQLPAEPLMLAIACMGRLRPRSWRDSLAAWDFYVLKGIVDALLQRLGLSASWHESHHPSYQKGAQARVMVAETCLGHVGEAHPDVRASFHLEAPVFMAEINLDVVKEFSHTTRAYRPIARFPAVRRDIAVIVPEDTPAEEIREAIVKFAGTLLEDVWLFDVYREDPVPRGHKSLAYGLTYRSDERTLLDAEVDEVHDKVRRHLKEMGFGLR